MVPHGVGWGGGITESFVDVVVEGVAVTVVAEAVVVGGELLQALCGDGGEVAGDLGVVGQHHGAARREAVYQPPVAHEILNILKRSTSIVQSIGVFCRKS